MSDHTFVLYLKAEDILDSASHLLNNELIDVLHQLSPELFSGKNLKMFQSYHI